MKIWNTEEFKEYHESVNSCGAVVLFLATCSGSRRRVHRPVTAAISQIVLGSVFCEYCFNEFHFGQSIPGASCFRIGAPMGEINVFSSQVTVKGEIIKGRESLIKREPLGVVDIDRARGELDFVSRLRCTVPGCRVQADLREQKLAINFEDFYPEMVTLIERPHAPIGVVKINFAELEEKLERHSSAILKEREKAYRLAKTSGAAPEELERRKESLRYIKALISERRTHSRQLQN